MKALKALTFLLAAWTSSAIFLDCEYFVRPVWFWDNYTCDVRNLTVSSDNDVVANVSQNHLERFSNDNVEILKIQNQICHRFPHGLGKFFPNLKEISIVNSSLEIITSQDLMPFEQLVSLDLNNNRLKRLDADLFINTLGLKSIDLSNNMIRFVGEKILNPLKSLRHVRLEKNNCINIDFGHITNRQLFWLKCELAINCTEPRDFNDITVSH